MRILVVSDTHSATSKLNKVLRAQPKAEIVIHLGDGENDIRELKPLFFDKMFLQVRGNCDWMSKSPIVDEYVINGVKIFFTHGHYYDVKFSDDDLINTARDRSADIVLYGHTHIATQNFDNGLYIMNPGSLYGTNPSYGIIDITNAGIVLNIVKIT